MDARVVSLTQRLLNLGLAIRTQRTSTGYRCEIISGLLTVATGVGETFLEARLHAAVQFSKLN